MYITHWRFHPSESVLLVAKHQLQGIEHPFENVFFMTPHDDEHVELRVLWPIDTRCFDGCDIEALKNSSYLVLDPDKWIPLGN
jgi:hypothetical protein